MERSQGRKGGLIRTPPGATMGVFRTARALASQARVRAQGRGVTCREPVTKI